MILGFQSRFEPFVVDGSKRHTIRAGSRWRVGMRADCFARPRQKGMRLLFRAPVTRVENIEMREGHIVIIDGRQLDADEMEAFAWADGFRPPDPNKNWAFRLMMYHWYDRLPFLGQVIHWDYDRRELP